MLDADLGGDGLERPDLREAWGSDPPVTADLSAEESVGHILAEARDADRKATDAALKLFESAA